MDNNNKGIRIWTYMCMFNIQVLYMELCDLWEYITKGKINMRNKEDLKKIRKTVLMTESTAKSIEREAAERGIKPNAVMNERLNHSKTDNTPPKMMQFQDFANEAVKIVAQYSETDAKKMESEAHSLWTF